MRIRWRLTWYGIGFTALALAVIIVLLIVLLQGTAGNDQDELLGSIADDAASALSTADLDEVTPAIPPIVPDATTSDQPFTTVYDEAGNPLAATGTVDGLPLDLPAAVHVEALETGASEATVDGVRVQARRWDNTGSGPGVVAASQSTRIVEEQLASLRVFLIIFAVIGLGAAAVGAWFMAGRALRPLRELAETTDDIGSTGDVSRRLPTVDRDDEVGALTSSFNTMLDTIEIAREQRDATIEGQKRFIADASHELRSPLTSIRANAGFLVDQPDASDADRRDATRDIATEADRMASLVDELIVMARADTAPQKDFVPVDLTAVVDDVQHRSRTLDVDLRVEHEGPVVVLGDRTDLEALVWILVDNADRHGATSVIVRAVTTGDRASVTVDDDGPGIPRDQWDDVFDRFYRGDPARSGPGHGLGLAIASGIAEAHRGSLTVDDAPLGGARFEVSLPIAP